MELVSLEDWKSYPPGSKESIAKQFLASPCAAKTLRQKYFIVQTEHSSHSEKVKGILRLLEKKEEPKLRTTWVVLQLDSFMANAHYALHHAFDL